MADYGNFVDFDADGDFSGPHEDITARTLDRRTPVTVRVGRDQARALSPIAPGECRYELNNLSRDYSPENASSPLAGMVLPARPALLQATLGATTHTLFNGHLDDFTLDPGVNARSVSVTCLDPLAQLKGVQASTEAYQGLRTGEAIGVLLDAVGWPADKRQLDPGATLMPWWWADGDAFDELMSLLDSEGPPSLATAGVDGSIVFRDRHHRLLSAESLTAQSTWRAGDVEPCFSDLTYEHGWKEIINQVQFPVQQRARAVNRSAVFEQPGQFVIAAGDTAQVAARTSGAFVGAVVPEPGVDFTLISGDVEVELSRTSGAWATIRIRAGAAQPAVISDLRLRAYMVETVSTLEAVGEEPASVTTYGPRSLPESRAPVWAGVHDSRSIIDLILGQRAQRLSALTVTFRGGGKAARLAQQLGRDLSDRVRVVDPETGLDGDFHIEQITHAITQGGAEHTTGFGCERVATQVTDLFTFDTAGRGFDDGRFGGPGLDDPATMFLFDTAGRGFDDGLFAH